jgi:hypothetical protein
MAGIDAFRMSVRKVSIAAEEQILLSKRKRQQRRLVDTVERFLSPLDDEEFLLVPDYSPSQKAERAARKQSRRALVTELADCEMELRVSASATDDRHTSTRHAVTGLT